MQKLGVVAASVSVLVAVGCGPTGAGAASPDAKVVKPPSTSAYRDLVKRIGKQRRVLERKLAHAKSPAQRRDVLGAARSLFEQGLAETLPKAWVGTPWAFSGTSQSPGRGTIACGYFVSTLLRDLGLRVERIKMAQQASERIIKSLTSEAFITRFSDSTLGAFLRSVRKRGEGLYVVGLDFHVGLLWVAPDRATFIHSSNVGCPTRAQGCVVMEPAAHSLALEQSRYRVAGQVSADPELLTRWLRGQSVPIK